MNEIRLVTTSEGPPSEKPKNDILLTITSEKLDDAIRMIWKAGPGGFSGFDGTPRRFVCPGAHLTC